jgi:hypothetical protein
MAVPDRLDHFRIQAGILHVASGGNAGADAMACHPFRASLGPSSAALDRCRVGGQGQLACPESTILAWTRCHALGAAEQVEHVQEAGDVEIAGHKALVPCSRPTGAPRHRTGGARDGSEAHGSSGPCRR